MEYRDVLFYCIAIAGWVIVLITFLWAFFHDGWYAFHINMFGEAIYELIFIIGIIGFMIYYFIMKVKKL